MEIKYDIKDVFERNPKFLLTGEVNNMRIDSVEGIFKPHSYYGDEGPVEDYWLYDEGELYVCVPLDIDESVDGRDLDTRNVYTYDFEKLEISTKYKDVIENIKKQLPRIQEELKSFLSEREEEISYCLEVTSKSIYDIEILEIILHEDIITYHPLHNQLEGCYDEWYDLFDYMHSVKHYTQAYRLAYLPDLHSIKNIDTCEIYPSSILDTVDEAIGKSSGTVGYALYKTIVSNVLDLPEERELYLSFDSYSTFTAWGKKVGLIPCKDKDTSETHHFS